MIPSNEYNPYYQPYITLAGDGDLLLLLQEGAKVTTDFFTSLSNTQQEHRYAQGKWTPKEILLHIIDTERVFSYRALHFSRANNVVLPGFDQDEFVAQSQANDRSMNSLIEEYNSVRKASISLFATFSKDALLSTGVASDSVMSVRAAGVVLCGHEKHHIQVIKERYL